MAADELLGNPVKDLSKRFLITFLLGIVVYRLGVQVPIPDIDVKVMNRLFDQAGGGIFEYLNMLNGGAIANASIFGLGIMPYISASIIFQLLAHSMPALKQLQKEGEAGRRKINQYTRYATVAICMIQAGIAASSLYGHTPKIEGETLHLVTADNHALFVMQSMLLITCGTTALLWIAEQITKFGVGNGVSVIIMISILSRMPSALTDLANSGGSGDKLPIFLGVIILFVAIIAGMVIITTARRRINLEQQRRVQGNKIYGGGKTQLPLMLNQASVIPVIFANPIMLALGFLFGIEVINNYTGLGQAFSQGEPLYRYIFIGVIIFFTYFYISITFDLNEMANHFKQAGFFIRGVKPGRNTVEYIKFRLDRITFVGAFSLAFIAVMPSIIGTMIGVPDQVAYTMLGGVGLLIVVGVGLDVIQKVTSYLLAHRYQGLSGSGVGGAGKPGGGRRGGKRF